MPRRKSDSLLNLNFPHLVFAIILAVWIVWFSTAIFTVVLAVRRSDLTIEEESVLEALLLSSTLGTIVTFIGCMRVWPLDSNRILCIIAIFFWVCLMYAVLLIALSRVGSQSLVVNVPYIPRYGHDVMVLQIKFTLDKQNVLWVYEWLFWTLCIQIYIMLRDDLDYSALYYIWLWQSHALLFIAGICSNNFVTREVMPILYIIFMLRVLILFIQSTAEDCVYDNPYGRVARWWLGPTLLTKCWRALCNTTPGRWACRRYYSIYCRITTRFRRSYLAVLYQYIVLLWWR